MQKPISQTAFEFQKQDIIPRPRSSSLKDLLGFTPPASPRIVPDSSAPAAASGKLVAMQLPLIIPVEDMPGLKALPEMNGVTIKASPSISGILVYAPEEKISKVVQFLREKYRSKK